jgi:hypothetical protein
MFKGILGKRAPSSEFTMLTAPGESAPNGKENCDPHPRPAKVRAVSAAFKPSKVKAGKEREEMGEGQVMEQAFDKLLVGLVPRLRFPLR